jgi:hypothetical protein
MVVNEQHPNYGTLTVMVHLATWHAIHFRICEVLYTQLTGTRSKHGNVKPAVLVLATDTSHRLLLYRNTILGSMVEAKYREV